MTTLGEAFVPIRATLDKLDSDLAAARKKTEGAMGGIAKIAEGVGNNISKGVKVALGAITVGLAAAGTGILLLGSSAVKSASNLNEALNASAVVFKESAGIIKEFGKTAAETTGLSATAFNQLAAETGSMLINYGLGADVAAEATVGLAQRAADMASIFNTDVSEAMAAIQSGLRGEANPLERFGVSMNAAMVEAKALAMGLEKVNGQFTNESLTLARLELLYEQTNSIAGDFVNTSDGLANASRIQEARWENFKATLGTKLLPVVQTVQGVFMNLAATVLPKLLAALGPVFEFVQRAGEAFASLVNNLMNGTPFIDALTMAMMKLFGTGVGWQFYQIATSIQEFFARVTELLAPVWEAITSFISWKDVLIGVGIVIAAVVLPALAAILAPIVVTIAAVAAIIAVVAALRNAWENNWGGIRTALIDFWENKGRPALEALREWLAVNIPIAIQKLSDFWTNTLQPAIAAVWAFIRDSLIPLFLDVVGWLAENIPVAIQKLANFWTTVLWPAIQSIWAFVKEKLIPIFLDVVGWLAENIPVAIAKAKDFWDNQLGPALSRVWQFIKEHLWPAFLDVGEWLLTTIGTAITTAKTFWEEHLKGALITVWSFITVSLWPAFLDVAKWLGETVGKVITIASGFWEDTLKPALDAVWNFITVFLLPAFESIGKYLGETLGGILDGITKAFQGISSAIEWLITKAGEVIEWFKKIAESIPDVLLGNSPSPFEVSLRGINEAMKSLDTQLGVTMPLFRGLGESVPAISLAGSESPQGSISESYTANTNIYTNRDPMRVLYASRHLDKLGKVRK